MCIRACAPGQRLRVQIVLVRSRHRDWQKGRPRPVWHRGPVCSYHNRPLGFPAVSFTLQSLASKIACDDLCGGVADVPSTDAPSDAVATSKIQETEEDEEDDEEDENDDVVEGKDVEDTEPFILVRQFRRLRRTHVVRASHPVVA